MSPRYSKDKPRLGDTLDIIKFLCKDFWQAVFKKQVDNLKTNHRVRAAAQGCSTHKALQQASSLPVGSLRWFDSAHTPPLHRTPLHTIPLHTTPLHTSPLHTTPLHKPPLHKPPLHTTARGFNGCQSSMHQQCLVQAGACTTGCLWIRCLHPKHARMHACHQCMQLCPHPPKRLHSTTG